MAAASSLPRDVHALSALLRSWPPAAQRAWQPKQDDYSKEGEDKRANGADYLDEGCDREPDARVPR
jgi:hypothetical protein